MMIMMVTMITMMTINMTTIPVISNNDNSTTNYHQRVVKTHTHTKNNRTTMIIMTLATNQRY